MRFNKLIQRTALLFALLMLGTSVSAQRAIPAADSVLGYRALNNLRVWTFTYKAKDLGRMVSFIDGVESVNGRKAVRINREFNIDYKLLNENRTAATVGKCFVSQKGYYLGDHLQVSTDSVAEDLELEVDGARLEGYYTRQGREIDQSLDWPRDYFAWDPNLLDQLELLLAMRPISVGGEFVDSIFQPQSLLFAQVAGYCDAYGYTELYKGKFDSVFAIHLSSPTPMDLYFTADRELVRADFLAQGIRAYQDVNSMAQPKTPSAPTAVGSRWSINRIMQYFTFVVIGLLGLLLYNRSFFRYLESYFALIAGAVAFLLTLVTQVPLQEMLLGAHAASESMSVATFLLPAAVTAISQELLKLIALALILRFLRPQPGRSTVVGALVGAMFGVMEAGWTVGFAGASLDFWTLMRSGAMILYHISAGVLIGSAIAGAAKKWSSVLGGMSVVHFVLRLLPAFAFTGMLDDPLVSLIIAALVLVQLALTLSYQLRLQKNQR